MKTILKTITIILVLLITPISIYYGLRIFNNKFQYTYTNSSVVITLPNKIWFELSGTQDYLIDKDDVEYKEYKIFETQLPDMTKSGYDIGLQYPKYSITTQSRAVDRIQEVTREKDTLNIYQQLDIKDLKYDKYISNIYFSQYGEIIDNKYSQEGCSVQVTSEIGKVISDEQYALIKVEYDITNKTMIKDNIKMYISCYER
jgi:hypothetical protein